jgi:hypothetical protein
MIERDLSELNITAHEAINESIDRVLSPTAAGDTVISRAG